jgi:hypothetical protein
MSLSDPEMIGADHDHMEFDNNANWPRRLLHVPTMTSYKWAPGNNYGRWKEPAYIALSYTWGRFQLDDGENPQVKPLQIKGVPWPIPRINPNTHFGVNELQHIIHQTMKSADRYYVFDSWKRDTVRGQTIMDRTIRTVLGFLEGQINVYEFLWLDIACIDQRESPIQQAEVGRQARIFRHARHSYVWLSHLTHSRLESLLFDLEKAVAGMQKEPYGQTPSSFNSRSWLLLALESVNGLAKDPWFDSLWTLQEAFLCNHAILLSRDGKVTCDASTISPRSWSLNYLFKITNDLILWSERTKAARPEPEFSQLLDSIRRTGLAALWYNSPMGLLGVSNYRQTKRELDRVYGIMQVFGTDFKVGHALEGAGQNREYTLPELEDEFGAAILHRFPVLSQMHVYLKSPAFSKGWCVRGSSAVPNIVERGDMFGWDSGNRLDINIQITCHNLCDLKTQKFQDNLWAHLSGNACAFDILQNAWWEADKSDIAKSILQSGWRMHRCSIQSIHMIALDKETILGPLPPEFNELNIVSIQDQNLQHQLAAWISKRSQNESLKVLLLGRCNFGDEAFNIGLITFEKGEQGVRHWHRVGICVWLISHLLKDGVEHPMGSLLKGNHEYWHHIEGLFG